MQKLTCMVIMWRGKVVLERSSVDVKNLGIFMKSWFLIDFAISNSWYSVFRKLFTTQKFPERESVAGGHVSYFSIFGQSAVCSWVSGMKIARKFWVEGVLYESPSGYQVDDLPLARSITECPGPSQIIYFKRKNRFIMKYEKSIFGLKTSILQRISSILKKSLSRLKRRSPHPPPQ